MEKTKTKVRPSLAQRLGIRKKIKKAKPVFKRQENWRKPSIGKAWRRPKGRHSKLRMGEKARGTVPSPGFRSPADVRGLNRLGYREIRVSSLRDMESLNPREEMAVISGTVGKRKREALLKLASERKIHVANG